MDRPNQKPHPSNKITLENLKAQFVYHPPTPASVKKYNAISEAAENLARVILENCPDCAMRSVALRHTVGVRMEANAAIACEPDDTRPETT